jgi:hypothetical protein
MSCAAGDLRHFAQRRINREPSGFLARRKFLEGLRELRHDGLGRKGDVIVVDDCHRPACPMLEGLGCVRKCMCVVLSQQNRGLPSFCCINLLCHQFANR